MSASARVRRLETKGGQPLSRLSDASLYARLLKVTGEFVASADNDPEAPTFLVRVAEAYGLAAAATEGVAAIWDRLRPLMETELKRAEGAAHV